MRALTCVALVVVSSGAPLAAQDSTARGAPGRFCLRARPKPECSGFALTNAGVYVVFGDNRGGETALCSRVWTATGSRSGQASVTVAG